MAWSASNACSRSSPASHRGIEMRKKRDPESDESRFDRLEKNAQERREEASAEDKMLDAAIRRSIAQYGA